MITLFKIAKRADYVTADPIVEAGIKLPKKVRGKRSFFLEPEARRDRELNIRSIGRLARAILPQ